MEKDRRGMSGTHEIIEENGREIEGELNRIEAEL